MAKLPIALQLYTIRDLTKTDFAGTMKQVAKIGYQAVELAGYGNLKSAQDVRKALDDAGLRAVGNHVGIDQLEKDLSKAVEENQVLGNRNICVPWMPEDRRKDAAGWRNVGQVLSKIGADLKARGFNLAYHNHSFEFQQFDGKAGMDHFYEASDPQSLKAELDVYWVQHGGVDPVQYVNQLGSRVLLLHLKDMAAGPEKKFAPVGTGILDFKGITDAGAKHGVQYGIVEQDSTYDMPPMEAVRISFENLKKLGVV